MNLGTELCHSAIRHCDQIAEMNDLRGKVYFDSQFRGLSPWSIGPLALGSRQNILAGNTWWSKAHLNGDQEAEREEGAGVPISPSRARPHDQLLSTRLHLLKVPPPNQAFSI